MYIVSLIVLTILIFLEGAVTTLPLTLIFLLCFTILKRDARVFPVAFFAGILLDLLKVRMVGATSVILIIVVFLVLLYQRKYEIDSYPFVAAAGFLGAIGFIILFGTGNIFMQGLLSSLLGIFLYGGARSLQQKIFSTHE